MLIKVVFCKKLTEDMPRPGRICFVPISLTTALEKSLPDSKATKEIILIGDVA